MAVLATTQHGVVSRAQLRELGYSDSAIARRVRAGRLHRIHAGVYAVGHPLVSREGRWLAAVLASGDGAVLSFRSAAALHGLERGRERLVELTVPDGRGRHAHPSLKVHRHATIAVEEITVVGAIPVTTPARTLLDLAAAVPQRRLERAVERAEDLRLFDLKEVQAVLERHRGQPGTRRLMTAIESWTLPPLTRSDLERRFLALCARHGIPKPQCNVAVRGYEVDFFWPERDLIVEIDGPHHFTRTRAEEDRIRDATLLTEGFRTLRYTERRLVNAPQAIATTTLNALNTPRAAPRPPGSS